MASNGRRDHAEPQDDCSRRGACGGDPTRHGAELAQDHNAHFVLTVSGPAQPIDPVVNNEAYRVAREAITNAFLHADAKQI